MIHSIPAILAQAAPQSGPPQSPLSTLMFLGPLMVVFYFLLIRPQQQREKEHQKVLGSIKVGDSVVTSSGMHGLVSSVKEKTVVLKVADNVKIEFDKSAVATITKSGA